MFTKVTRAEERPRRNRFIEHSVQLIRMVLVELTTKLRIDYMRELQYAIIVFSLLLFEVREIKRFLESCYRDPRKILRVSRNSILDTRASNLDARSSIASSIEDRVSSRDCQLTFARYCRSQRTSKYGKNISGTLGCALCDPVLFLPHFDVICDLLLNRRTATWNLFANCILLYTTIFFMSLRYYVRRDSLI